VRHEGHVFSSQETVPTKLSKPGWVDPSGVTVALPSKMRLTELYDPSVYRRRVRQEPMVLLNFFFPMFRLISKGPHIEDAVRDAVIGIQVFSIDRPSAVWNPGALLENDRIEWSTVAAPQFRRAPKALCPGLG
jgi:hypothetical protein